MSSPCDCVLWNWYYEKEHKGEQDNSNTNDDEEGTNMKVSLISKSWVSLNALRNEATTDPLSISSPLPQSIVESSSSPPSLPIGFMPRLAKDETYASDILKAWNQDVKTLAEGGRSGDNASAATTQHSRNNDIETYGCVFPYTRCDGVEYSGYLVIPSKLHKRIMNPGSSNNNGSNADEGKKVPVVIMFHTGAGPQDIFNRYKADLLVRQSIWSNNNKRKNSNSNDHDHGGDYDDKDGCIVFIADIVSDFVGWTWGDRDRYWQARKELLQISSSVRTTTDDDSTSESDDNNSEERQRIKLRQTLSAVVDAVKSIDIVDCKKIAAMGFCLGGQPILELGRMQVDGIVGLISFHGLFDGIDQLPLPQSKLSPVSSPRCREALICNGKKRSTRSRK
mmetsp:Transcript_9241/g.13743  ORF Transcript_9241/g.13743 Transcript_9241/m.13743 type:complete len:393 (+) Transcript_9241:96-1274(+)